MKTLIRFVSTLALNSVLALPHAAWSQQQEAVSGYYDRTNNWIVLQWLDSDGDQAQSIYDSANKINPQMRATVTLDQSSVNYTYSYQVTNLTGAVQPLADILVKHRAAVFGSTAPNPSSERDSSEYAGKSAWSWTKVRGTVHGIPAGQTVSGFSFQSKGLPTIVDAGFTGKRRVEFTSPFPIAVRKRSKSYVFS